MIYSDKPDRTIVNSQARYGAFLLEKTKRTLRIGRVYTLPVETFDEKGRAIRSSADYRLINIYPHHALFIRSIRPGVQDRRCIGFAELSGLIISDRSKRTLLDRLDLSEDEKQGKHKSAHHKACHA